MHSRLLFATICHHDSDLVNVRLAASLQVELREKGKALEGFSLHDAVPLNGNHHWSPCRWRGRADLAGLKGKSLQLRMCLTSAKVFGYGFV